MLPNNALATYVLSLALRPCHDETREFVKINRHDLYAAHPDSKALNGATIYDLAEIAPAAVRYDESTGNVYLTRPEARPDAWEALFPGLDLDGLMCAALDAGYLLGVPLGALEKMPHGLNRRTRAESTRNGIDAWASLQHRNVR